MNQTFEARNTEEKSTWPTVPFYLMSRVELLGFVLTPNDGGELNIAPIQEDKTEIQLWQATPDQRGGASLKHVVTGKNLSFRKQGDANKVMLLDEDRSDRNQLWELADFGDKVYSAIHPLADEWANLNVLDAKPYGTVQLWAWNKGAQNECWMSLTETGKSIVKKIDYHTGAGAVNVTPGEVSSDYSIADNTNPRTPLEARRTLTRTRTKSHQVSNSQENSSELVFTQSFEISGGVESIFEAKVGGGFEQHTTKTISLTNTDQVDESTSTTFEVKLDVPAGRKYAYDVVETIEKCSVPYTAFMEFRSSVNKKPRCYQVEGRIDNTYSTGTTLVVRDITNSEKPLELTKKPVV